MKKLLITLLSALAVNFTFADTADSTTYLRINGIFVDEVLDGGDEGTGITGEFGFIVGESDGFIQTVGVEAGFITSESDDISLGNEVETDLVPLFLNCSIRGDFDLNDFSWELGAGLGGIFTETEIDSDSDSDFVFGGQVFGRIAYELEDEVRISAGIRYMLADDPDFQGAELSDTLNSAAIDLSLTLPF